MLCILTVKKQVWENVKQVYFSNYLTIYLSWSARNIAQYERPPGELFVKTIPGKEPQYIVVRVENV